MSQIIEIKCDECGKIKKESNHWFKIDHAPNFMCVYKDLDPGAAVCGKILDACGVECVIKMLSKWVG